MPRKTVAKKSQAKEIASKTAKTKKTSVVKKPTPKMKVEKAVTKGPKQSFFTTLKSNTTLQKNLRNPRLWIGAAVVILAILLYAIKGLFIAAVVNGQPISRLAVIQQLEAQGGKDALNSLITQALVTQEAQKQHITVSQSDINADEAQITSALKSQGMTLDEALAARGMTKSQLDQQIALQKMIEKMVGKNVKVTDQQVADYISKNKDSLPQGLSDAQLNAQVKQQLEQQQLQDLTQQYVNSLQQKASIQYFVSY